MDNNKPRILMIGSLPPPAVGPYLAMQRLLDSTALKGAVTIDFLDISDRRSLSNIGRFDWLNLLLGMQHAFQCLSRLLLRPPGLVYLGISQGTWGYLRDLAFILPALCLRRPLVLHLRGSEFRTFYEEMPGWLRWLTRWVLSRTARVIVLGTRLRAIFDGLMDPEKIAVIPNGINCDAFEVLRSKIESRKNPAKRILYLAHLSKRKGIFVLLEAMPEILAQHPDAIVTIAGLWQDSADKTAADAFIDAAGLTDKITFVGEVTGVRKVELFLQHDIFVFTPIAPEGLPWVLLEAMSAGLAVVTSDQGAITEVVLDGVTGVIVPPQATWVSQTVRRLLSDPTCCQAMGRAGRDRVGSHFSEEVYFQSLAQLFEEVARSPSAPVVWAAAGRNVAATPMPARVAIEGRDHEPFKPE